MRKLLVMMGFLLLSLGSSFAQRGGGNATPEMRAEQQTKRMTEALGLSADQQKQVYALQLNRVKKMQELRDTQNREGMKAAQEEFQKGLSAILTPEQIKKNEEMEAEMRANRGQGGQRGPR